MADQELKQIEVDGITYNIDDLSEAAKRSLEHLYSIDIQVSKLYFDLEQLNASRDTFQKLLRENLQTKTSE
jgi:hypothetical protein